MKVSRYKFIDEEKLYVGFRSEQPPCEAPLRILLVCEHNPERIYAFEQTCQKGHK